eukprot:TRINITY_DN6044_c0_g1_i1.p1 TRINITY_DN6044_c0_g1~~TRINITY_DN6044_c0_g1_i1.p1  ORF type:complete len:1423 (+),score=361.94 TRINITY_DN6044_c0_g1_i1:32-4270(+)
MAVLWAKSISDATGVRTRLSQRELEMVSFTPQEGDDPEEVSAMQELHDFLQEARLNSDAFAATSVVYAGFVSKWRGRKPGTWQQRYFVVHESGVVHYYEGIWAPGSQKEPRRTLLLQGCEAVVYAADIQAPSSVKWNNVPEEHRLAVVFPNRTYYLYTNTAQSCSELVIALQTVAELIEPDDDSFDIYDNLVMNTPPSDFADEMMISDDEDDEPAYDFAAPYVRMYSAKGGEAPLEFVLTHHTPALVGAQLPDTMTPVTTRQSSIKTRDTRSTTYAEIEDLPGGRFNPYDDVKPEYLKRAVLQEDEDPYARIDEVRPATGAAAREYADVDDEPMTKMSKEYADIDDEAVAALTAELTREYADINDEPVTKMSKEYADIDDAEPASGRGYADIDDKATSGREYADIDDEVDNSADKAKAPHEYSDIDDSPQTHQPPMPDHTDNNDEANIKRAAREYADIDNDTGDNKDMPDATTSAQHAQSAGVQYSTVAPDRVALSDADNDSAGYARLTDVQRPPRAPSSGGYARVDDARPSETTAGSEGYEHVSEVLRKVAEMSDSDEDDPSLGVDPNVVYSQVNRTPASASHDGTELLSPPLPDRDYRDKPTFDLDTESSTDPPLRSGSRRVGAALAVQTPTPPARRPSVSVPAGDYMEPKVKAPTPPARKPSKVALPVTGDYMVPAASVKRGGRRDTASRAAQSRLKAVGTGMPARQVHEETEDPADTLAAARARLRKVSKRRLPAPRRVATARRKDGRKPTKSSMAPQSAEATAIAQANKDASAVSSSAGPSAEGNATDVSPSGPDAAALLGKNKHEAQQTQQETQSQPQTVTATTKASPSTKPKDTSEPSSSTNKPPSTVSKDTFEPSSSTNKPPSTVSSTEAQVSSVQAPETTPTPTDKSIPSAAVPAPSPKRGPQRHKSSSAIAQSLNKDDLRRHFDRFLDAEDLLDMQQHFKAIMGMIGADKWRSRSDFYVRVRKIILSKLSYKQKRVFETIDKQLHHHAEHYNDCTGLACAIIGAGPVGLRAAVGMALLGASVHVVEKRNSFGRHNILHLWDWVCADLIKLGANGAEIYGKSFYHIGTRQLQLLLARIAMLLGVQFHVECTAAALLEPAENDPNPLKLWRLQCEVKPRDASVALSELYLPCHVVLDAAGAADSITSRLGFASSVMATSSALGLVVHYRRNNSPREREMEEFSWARQYNQPLFDKLKALGADLENCVYYCGNTHYYVMTPKKASLLEFGVLKENKQGSELLARANINMDKLQEYARIVASFFDLPETCPLATEAGGAMLFDFSSRKACLQACQVLESHVNEGQICVMPIGDSLLEPFWPEGLGINRGFHSALDAMWVLQRYFSTGGCEDARDIEAARDNLFGILKGLSAFTKGNIVHAKFKDYDLHPSSRYKVFKESPLDQSSA